MPKRGIREEIVSLHYTIDEFKAKINAYKDIISNLCDHSETYEIVEAGCKEVWCGLCDTLLSSDLVE